MVGWSKVNLNIYYLGQDRLKGLCGRETTTKGCVPNSYYAK